MTKQKDIKQAYNMEPEEIIKYFDSKGLKTSYNWREVWQEAHAKAFTVAKMTNTALLKDTQTMLKTALKEGWSEGKFKKNASELFEKRGWVGFKEVTNPRTGEKETVELGTPRRIVNIFRTNMRTAYAAGRYKEQLEDVDIAPYLQYVCVLDERTRPEHRAMHGKVFRYDDPFWSVFYPPNGWGCRCSVRSLTPEEVKRRGLKVDSSGNDLTSVDVGEQSPVGNYKFKVGGKTFNLTTDSGWSYNPGACAWDLDVQAYNKIKDLPQTVKDRFISEMAQNPHRKDVVENYIKKSIAKDYRNTPQEVALTWFTPKIITALKENKVEPVTPVVSMKLGKTTHTRRDKKVEIGQALSVEQSKNLWDYVNNADEVYIDTQDFALIYIKHLPEDEIIDGRDVIKIPVKINNKNKKLPVNYIGTLSKIHYIDLKRDKRYKKIE